MSNTIISPRRQSKLKSLFNKLQTPETVLVAVAAGLIEFQIEGVLWQTVASIVVVAAALLTVLSKSKTFGTAIQRDWLKYFGAALIFAFAFVAVYNPVPAHAILIQAQNAIVAGINGGIQDPIIAAWVSGSVITIMWVGRAVLLAMAIKMGIEVVEGRKEEQPWKELLQKPLTFIMVILITNQIGNMLTTI